MVVMGSGATHLLMHPLPTLQPHEELQVSPSAATRLRSNVIAGKMCGYVKHKPVKGKREGGEWWVYGWGWQQQQRL